FFFFQAEDGIRDSSVTGVQTCALPIFDFNENTAGCGPAVLRALAKLTPRQLAMYPEYQKPTARIARHLGVRSKELLLPNGGDDALRVFFDTFVEPHSHILICEPTFPM